MPGKKRHGSDYAQRRHKKSCKRRSAIEAIRGHLKNGHRLGRNYLEGSLGGTNNTLLAGMGFNLLLLMRWAAGNWGNTMVLVFFCLNFRGKLRFAQN